MALFVKGFRVLRRVRNDKGMELFKKVGRVFHVRSSAQALCDMLNADARARGSTRPAADAQAEHGWARAVTAPVSNEEYFVGDVVGRDPEAAAKPCSKRVDTLLLDLDPRVLARGSDPSTSHAAAAQLTSAHAHRIRILETLEQIGTGTFEQIAEAAHLRDSQVWRRLSDLHSAGLVTPTGDERIGRSGRNQRIWRLAHET